MRDVILVEWRSSDGVSGWGECPTFNSPGYVIETTDQAWAHLSGDLVPALVRPENLEILEILDGSSAGAVPAAVAALRDSRLDNELRRSGSALAEHLGGAAGPVERTAVIAAVGDDVDATVRRARAGIASGASLIKVKISPSADVVVLDALVRAIGSQRLAADANGSYRDASDLAEVDSMGLRYLEQPFGAEMGWAEMGEQVRRLRTPVALDESIRCMSDVEQAARSGAGQIVSIKPARLGGVEASALALRRAADLGLGAFVGGMVELAVGRATALALATIEALTLPTDLGPSTAYFAGDIADTILADSEGRIRPPAGAGIGLTPDPVRLERFAVDRLEFVP